MSKEQGQFQNRPENRNTKGRPAMSKEMRALRKYKGGEILEVIQRVLSMPVIEADAWLENPKCTLLDKSLITVMKKGQVDILLNRVLGKCPETVNLNTADDVEIIDTTGMSEEEIRKNYYERLQKITGKRF